MIGLESSFPLEKEDGDQASLTMSLKDLKRPRERSNENLWILKRMCQKIL